MMRAIGLATLALSVSISTAGAVPIANVTATASSTYGVDDRGANHVVDGSGIFGNGAASNFPVGTMWLSNGDGNAGGVADTNQSITFDLGGTYLLGGMQIWNYNELNLTARGIATADVFVSLDGLTYTLAKSMTLDQAPGTATSDFSQTVAISATARYVRFGDITNFAGDDDAYTGLSEVQFMSAQAIMVSEPVSLALLGMGVAGMLVARRPRED